MKKSEVNNLVTLSLSGMNLDSASLISSCSVFWKGERGGGGVDCPVMEYPIFAWANLRLFSQYSNILIGWLHTKDDGRVVSDRSSCTTDSTGGRLIAEWWNILYLPGLICDYSLNTAIFSSAGFRPKRMEE
jgi:hypothetical protein